MSENAVNLTATIGTTRVRLASWLPPNERFQDKLTPVDPRLQFTPNDPTSLVARFNQALWKQDDWSAGMGYRNWTPETQGYEGAHDEFGVRVDRNGFLVGTPVRTSTVDNGGSSTFQDGTVLGYAKGTLYVGDEEDVYAWDETNNRWGAVFDTGATTTKTLRAIAHPVVDGNVFSLHGEDLRKWDGSTSSAHYTNLFGTNNIYYGGLITAFRSSLYGLSNADVLFLLDTATANTRTTMYDPVYGTASALEFFGSPTAINRLTTSDVGPVWYTRFDNGETIITQYNEYTDTAEVIGTLPITWAWPYSIHFANGILFVGFRQAFEPTEKGLAYIYWLRGSQSGVIGPIPEDGFSDITDRVLIAGTYGDDLMIAYGNFLWAYNFSRGGIHRIAGPWAAGTTVGIRTAKMFGSKLFVAGHSYSSVGKRVEHWDMLKYDRATFLSGMYDLGYPDIPKMIQELTVITSGTSGDIASTSYLADENGNAVTLPAINNTSGRFNWNISTPSSTFNARRIQVFLDFNTDSSDDTVPLVIENIIIRATAAAHEREFTLIVDLSAGSSDPEISSTSALIGELQALVDAQTLVTFTFPWENNLDGGQAESAVVVQVRDVSVTDAMAPDARPTAVVKLLARDLVT